MTDNGRNLKIELELSKAEFAKSGSWAWVLPPGASVAAKNYSDTFVKAENKRIQGQITKCKTIFHFSKLGFGAITCEMQIGNHPVPISASNKDSNWEKSSKIYSPIIKANILLKVLSH